MSVSNSQFIPPNTLNKINILAATNNGLDVFHHYIPDFKDVGKNFKSVFREDKHPSANVFHSTSGEYLYKDFGDGKAMGIFKFVMELKRCEFFEAVAHITNDLKLKPSHISIEGGAGIDYWNQYCDQQTMESILEKFNVVGVKSYVNDKGLKVISNNPTFAFLLGEGYAKIYKPLEKNNKHFFLGTKPVGYENIYGINEIPDSCSTILIVEGFKDCIVANANLNKHNIYAVGVDNASTNIKHEVIKELRSKCQNLVICYDIDPTGLKMSGQKSQLHGLRNFILPDVLKESGGKDISDWFKLKLNEQLLLDSLSNVVAFPEPIPAITQVSQEIKLPLLESLLKTEILIGERATEPIVYSTPLIKMGEAPIFRRGTINIIQGKFGSHKSRLAELFCSLMLSKSNGSSDHFLGFEKTQEPNTVVYIDTERNLAEELPSAIQSIKHKAGYELKDMPSEFRFTSVKQCPRSERLQAVKSFIEEVRTETNNNMYVLLDVVTDCVANFNDPVESMKLFDYIGNLCENYNCTFLLVIHQNPNSDKARGHTGTEATNKASTVMQIGFEKGKNNEDSELISLKFLKIRSAKRPEPLFLKYDESQQGLINASLDLIQKITAEKKQVAQIEAIAEKLGELLSPSLNQKDLLQKLKSTFNCSENTLKDRLQEIANRQMEIINERSHPCTLQIKTANGKSTLYELEEIEYLLELD